MIKIFALILLIILSTSSAIIIESAFAQSIPKPSVPEFTLKYVDYSYDVPPTYKIDEYTGETVVATGGYHVKNMTIQVTIKNQPFSHSFNDFTYHLYYNVRFKGHFGKDWSETPSVVTLSSSPSTFSEYVSVSTHNSRLREQSRAEYTIFMFSANDYPPNAPIDFQVETVLGHDSQAWVPDEPFAYNPAHYYTAIAFDETSGWSNKQTITIPETSTSTSPTPNPTPTPTVPELQTWTIPLLLSLIIATAGLLVYHKKHKHNLVTV